MARTVKPEQFASKRGKILEAVQRVVFTKGYAQMSLQDVLDEARISSGAFHHYFDSREALLDAFIEQIKQETDKPLLPVLQDPQLTAIEKLQGFFDTLGRLRTDHQADVISLGRVWYTDANAVVRQRVDEALRQQRAPLVTDIVRQGVREGLFTTAYPEQSGEVILTLWQGMGNTHAQLFLSFEQAPDQRQWVDTVVATHAAYMEAIERVLGAPPHCLRRLEADVVSVWVAALQGNGQA